MQKACHFFLITYVNPWFWPSVFFIAALAPFIVLFVHIYQAPCKQKVRVAVEKGLLNLVVWVVVGIPLLIGFLLLTIWVWGGSPHAAHMGPGAEVLVVALIIYWLVVFTALMVSFAIVPLRAFAAWKHRTLS